MNISEEDVKQDENAKKFIDLSHIEMPLPDINDLSEYASADSKIYKGVSKEKVQEALDFLEKVQKK